MALILAGLMHFSMSICAAEETEEIVSIDLEESIILALKNNHDIEQSVADRDSAKWSLSQARRQTGPTLNYELDAVRRGQNAGGQNAVGNSFSHTFGVSMPIYHGGELKSQRDQRRLELNAADLALENTKQEIKMQTTSAYYSILRCRDMIQVRQEEVGTMQQHLDLSMVKYKEGVVAKSDILASEVALANAKQRLVTAKGDYDKAIATLNNIIGLSVGTQLAIHDELKYVKHNLKLDKCIEYALENRPDYAAAEYNIKRARAAIEEQRAGTRPTVDANASKSAESDRLLEADNRTWQAGMVVKWNVFDNGVTTAGVRQMQAQLRKAISSARKTKDTLELEVRNAYTDLIAAEDNVKTTKVAVDQASEDYEPAQLRYVEGVGTNLDVMDAQEKLTEARTNYAGTLYNYNTAISTLEKAMGVPVDIDVPMYVESVENGSKSDDALIESSLHEEESADDE